MTSTMLIKEAGMAIYFFSIYSLLGWLLENCYNLITNRKFFKPNFFVGPFKPMYGFAPLLLVYLITPERNWMIVILLCFIIPTLVEYVSGMLLQRFFNRQWWDYSSNPLQLHGHICLLFSAYWGILSLLCIKIIHPFVLISYEGIGAIWNFLWPIILFYFIVEFVAAIRRHSALAQSISNPIH
ncbi:putative ABC transporter permease [Cytobacillus massiliigabonensis]|uniref:putative ABC transporter permease n=1 Tax=Cytobacillus massiliigabonensis TaxID=1871011 RepID=UPI001F2C27DE|nr:putative ABC transporter permease [Cytobacillus massiliigabonensis]